jgi:dipeptidyl aminopeptidase/acylaminoacyl peptidase
VGRAYFQIITHEAERSIPRVLDFLQTVPQLDPDRISIAGSSTSGFIALQAMAAEPRIALGVVRAACGDYHTFLRLSNLGLAGDPRWLVDGEMVLDADYEAEIRGIEPIGRAERFPPRPLLLVTGSADPAIPAECARRTADRFASAYSAAGAADRFHFVELDGQGHNLGAESARLAFEWWDRWLP